MGDLRQRFEVGDVETRVADRLDIDRFGLSIDGAFEIGRVVTRYKLHADTEARQGHFELVVGTAVERTGADDIVARLRQIGDRKKLRRLS